MVYIICRGVPELVGSGNGLFLKSEKNGKRNLGFLLEAKFWYIQEAEICRQM